MRHCEKMSEFNKWLWSGESPQSDFDLFHGWKSSDPAVAAAFGPKSASRLEGGYRFV
jgi:hypothetical protein